MEIWTGNVSAKITTGVPTIQHICTAKGRQFISFQTYPREGKVQVTQETYSDAPAESDMELVDILSGSSEILCNKLRFMATVVVIAG